jgi:hypothetical protein
MHSDELARMGIGVLTRPELLADERLAPLIGLQGPPTWTIRSGLALRRLPGHTLVVSEENMLGLMPGHSGDGFYAAHARGLKSIALFSRVFDTSVRWVVRRQDRFLESVYAFRVSRGATDDFLSFSRRFANTLHWLPIAKGLFAQKRCDLRIALFEDVIAGGSQSGIARFLSLPAADGLWAHRLRPTNRSVRGASLNVMLHLARERPGMTLEQRKAAMMALAALPTGPLPPLSQIEARLDASGVGIPPSVVRWAHAFAAKEPRPEFDASQRTALLAHYADENRELLAMPCMQGSAELWRLPAN